MKLNFKRIDDLPLDEIRGISNEKEQEIASEVIKKLTEIGATVACAQNFLERLAECLPYIIELD